MERTLRVAAVQRPPPNLYQHADSQQQEEATAQLCRTGLEPGRSANGKQRNGICRCIRQHVERIREKAGRLGTHANDGFDHRHQGVQSERNPQNSPGWRIVAGRMATAIAHLAYSSVQIDLC